ncbi:AP-3 complex subunit delta-1-like isoform X4 [Lineus longissimus]|uniref:AP-3 complex subunit delta-1-like isoform X4 n=1 Tax=Lineus longissimus TaxID=88925 RepID=UPI00315D642B
MALKKVKGTLDRVMEKNLQDLVRGIRNHKETESKYIAECIDEIKQELRQENVPIKANAVSKLTYLQMLGYDISWAAFNIIEVMSSTKFTYKRMGYLAASQSFHEGTDVLMLTTNMIRKDLSAQNIYDAGVALNGLSCFMTTDLARDLANDIMTLMSSSKPYLRKKAILLMYKVFLAFPEALRPAFPRLKDKLEDQDPGVQSAAVNVICELARKNPKNYLSLAPVFFKLMTSSSNNWVLIKIIKLFGALTPLEPRLGKKLIEPLTNLIHSNDVMQNRTSAMSLLYECINTVIAGVPNHSASIQDKTSKNYMDLCVQKLRILIEDSDQNLKYLGLLAMSKILKTHPKSVQAHKDLILQCLDDKDESIRLRALDLLYGMVSKKNLMEIVKKLMVHMDKAEGSNYRDELLSKIIEICSQSNYQYITNFEWYVSILVELTRIEGTRHGKLIANQMLDVAIRVQAIRSFAVSQMAILLENSHILVGNSQRNGICEVLYAAAWICGEFSEHLKDTRSTLEAMLRPKVTQLPGHIQSIYVQNILKLYSRLLSKAEQEEDMEQIKEVGNLLMDKLPMFVQSADLEVQERACCVLQLMKYVIKLQEKGNNVADEVSAMFAGELNPVATKAQRKVPVPDGLDLDQWINEPPSDSSDDELKGANIFTAIDRDDHRRLNQTESRKTREPTDDELRRSREQRRMEQQSNPNYLKGDVKGSLKYHDFNNYDDVPVAELDINIPLHVSGKTLPGLSSSDVYLKIHQKQQQEIREKKGGSKKKKKHRKGKKNQVESDEEEVVAAHVVSTKMDAPESSAVGATGSDKETENDMKPDDPHKYLDINLDEPLRDDEKIPVRQHRVVSILSSEDHNGEQADTPKKKRKKERHHKKKEEKKTDKKKHKKEHRHRHSSRASEHDDGPNLLVGSVEDHPDEDLTKPTSAKPPNTLNTQPNEEKTVDDFDFWLSGSDSVSTPAKSVSPVTPSREKIPEIEIAHAPIDDSDEDSKHDEQKHRKKKKEKTKHKKKEKKKKNKSEYEEAEGITTPSKEQVPPSSQPTPVTPQLPPMSSYQLLGENIQIKMMYETRVNAQQSKSVVVSVIFSNLTENHIKDLEFNVMDSMNTKLLRGVGASVHDAVKVPFILLPTAQNEGQFAFSLEHINMPQKLKGTLTYIVKTDEGSTHEKLDFRINLPCSAYMVGASCKGAMFTELLGSGELSEKYSNKFTPVDTDLALILAKTCFYGHFSVVEQIENSASLYGKSIQGHHVCLLVKMLPGNVLSVDAKSSDASLVSNLVDDIKSILTKSS